MRGLCRMACSCIVSRPSWPMSYSLSSGLIRAARRLSPKIVLGFTSYQVSLGRSGVEAVTALCGIELASSRGSPVTAPSFIPGGSAGVFSGADGSGADVGKLPRESVLASPNDSPPFIPGGSAGFGMVHPHLLRDDVRPNLFRSFIIACHLLVSRKCSSSLSSRATSSSTSLGSNRHISCPVQP